jgi:conjugal transfer pilus assembly protein TraF
MTNSLRIVLLIYLVSMPVHAGFFSETAEGWHWYCVQKTKQEEQKLALMSPTEQVNFYSKLLAEKLHRAWVYPTVENIKRYQEMQQDLMQRSTYFASAWMHSLYKTPDLDYTLVSPVNHLGRSIYLEQQKSVVKNAISKLKNTHGLFFFFKGNCAYCETFAPIVQAFSQKYGWEVLAISADGTQLPGFERSQMDNGLLEKWNISVLPALFAIAPQSQQVLPIAFGLVSLEEIETRLMNVIQPFL